MASKKASRWVTNAAVAVLLCGCFDPDDPPVQDTDGGSSSGQETSQPSTTDPTDSGSTGPSTTNPTNPTTTDSSSTDTSPVTTDPTDSGTETTAVDDTGTTTGVEPACGDGSVTAGELCLDVTPNSLMAPPEPVDVAVADLSSNGLLDIAVVARGANPNTDNRFIVLEADGVGGFIQEQDISVPPYTSRVRLADMDNDDDPDVVVNGATIRWLRNQGSFFSNALVYNLTLSAEFDLADAFVADLDGDGILDVGFTEAYGRRWVRGVVMNGNWTPGASANIPGPGEGSSGMAVGPASFDGADMDPDMILFNQYYSSGLTILNLGSGNLMTGVDVPLCPADIDGVRYGEMADFNDDGVTDVVVTCMDGDGAVTLGEGAGFGLPTALPLAGAFKPFVADLDGDGDPDVLMSSRSLDRAVMFINDGAGNFELSDIQFQAPGPVWGAVAADLDDDGAMDVVVASAPAGMPGRVDVYIAEP